MGIHYNKGAELLDFVKNKEDFSMDGGFFKPLTKPGLGVDIDEARVIELSKSAPDWRNPLWRHADGSVAEGSTNVALRATQFKYKNTPSVIYRAW